MAAAILAAGLAAGSARALPQEGQVWQSVETPGFTVIGNAGVEDLRAVAREMESLRIVLARIGGSRPGDVHAIPVIVFADEASFDPYRTGFGSSAKHVAGFFTERAGRSMIALTTTRGEGGHAPVYHEYLHHVIETKLGRVPGWFNEGIAGVYETFACDGKTATVGRAPRDKIRWLTAKPWVPLADVFRRSETAKIHEGDDEATTAFYVESWLLVHDLFFGHPARRPQLAAFLEAYAKGTPHDAAFEASFPGGIAAIETEIRAYVHEVFPYVTLSFEDLKVPAPGEPRKLERVEALDTLGELALISRDDGVAFAEEHFKAALALAPSDLRAQAGLGEAAILDRRTGDGLARLVAAIDAGYSDPVALRLAAIAAVAGDKRKEGTGAREEWAAASARSRSLAERALKAYPDDADLLAAYGATFVGQHGDVSAGIEALTRCETLEPGRQDVRHNLFWLYVEARDREKVEALVARAGDAGDPAERASMREGLVSLDLRDADDAVKARDYAAALAHLRSARAATGDESLKREIDLHIKQLEPMVPAAKRNAPAASKPAPPRGRTP